MEHVRLDKEDHRRLESLFSVRYVLVISEDWCGDAVLNLPIIARMVEVMPRADLQVAYRSQHRALREILFARGVTQLPVAIFMEDNFEVLALWEEHPEIHREQFEEWKRSNPEFLRIKATAELSDDERREKLEPFYARLLEDMYEWYDGELDFQSVAVEEMVEALTKATPQQGEP